MKTALKNGIPGLCLLSLLVLQAGCLTARTLERAGPGDCRYGKIVEIRKAAVAGAALFLELRSVSRDGEILEANQAMAAGSADVKLWLGETWIETPRKAGLGWSEELKAYGAKAPGGSDLVRIPVRVLRLNDPVLWGSPVELFCEIALRVRAESPFRHTFFLGYCNGWMGYLPTAQAFKDGGYEPRTSPFSEQVERDYTEGVLTYLHGLPRN